MKPETTPEIKFSHDYPKLGGTKQAFLLDVWKMNTKEFSKKFVEYDTIYIEDNTPRQYPLPEGDVLVLIFHGIVFNVPGLFTTIRRFTPSKEMYYRNQIGKAFNVIIEHTPK